MNTPLILFRGYGERAKVVSKQGTVEDRGSRIYIVCSKEREEKSFKKNVKRKPSSSENLENRVFGERLYTPGILKLIDCTE